jgi:hypothetical protein
MVASSHPDEAFTKQEGIEWCVYKWDEETYEAENDISSLAISFLLLQATRFNLTGIMPDNIGIEEENWLHPSKDVYSLAGVGLILAVLCCLIVVVYVETFPESVEIAPGTCMSFVKRLTLVLKGTTAMGFAWSLMYSAKWQITILLPELNPNFVLARVLLALTVTVIAYFIILGLDFLKDQTFTGEKTDKSIEAIIQSMSTLVGFTWEQSFDGALEVVGENSSAKYRLVIQLALTAGIVMVTLPQWRRYILRTYLRLLKEKEEMDKAGS